MKKLIYSAAAIALAFLAASCQKEMLEPVATGNTVTYTVQVADAVATKALGDDVNAVNELVYEVYRTEAEETTSFTDADNLLYHKTATITNGTATIELEFVNDQNFTVLFWAQTKDNGVYNVSDLTNVTITSPDVANNVNAQAFVGRDFVRDCVSDANGKVTLRRAVSQLNIATTPESLVKFDDAIALNGSSVKVSGLATSYNIATLAAFGETATEYEYTEAAVPTDALTINGEAYTYVAMNYVGFAPEMGANVTISYVINTTEGNIDNEITNVPVKPNYRTNIVGNLITSKTEYTITLEKNWYTPEEVVEYWNGSEMNAPQPSATDANVYEIEFPSELAWLAAAVNGTLPAETKAAVEADSYAGKTFVLMNDVDLNGFEWTPIGSSSAPFQGVFDGNGKTIKNLVVTGYNSYAGLFGNTNSGEIKNLTVENAKVSGRLNVGVVAGQPYTSKYTNITVKGHVEVNGMAYVGAVGGKNAYADWTNITVNVDETSYVKAHSIENGNAYRTYVGGVVGFNGEDGHVFSNITSNINVKGSTCDVGGLFGIAHYGNKFVNCICTGNVEIYAAEEADEAQEIGGIAGVWHNGGANVVMTDCSFTGTLKTNIEGVNFYNGCLVGKPYSATGKGKLIIDGAVYVASATELQTAVNAASGETVIKLAADIEGNVTVIQKQGVKITVDGNEQKYNGSIKVHSNSNHYADAALTIKNVNFEASAASINVIEALEKGAERYSTNITVEDCTFSASGEAVNTAVGVQIKSSKNAKVINCTAKNMHSLIQAQSCDETVVVKGCTVNGKNGVAFKQVKAATVESTTITALEYGIRFDGNTDNYGIVVKDNKVTAVQPLIVRKMTGKNNTIALEGTNTLTTEAEYQIVITNDSDDAEYVMPTGTYALTGADSYKVFPTYPAMIGQQTYNTLAAAVAAVKEGETIVIAGTISEGTIKLPATLKNVTFQGKTGVVLKDMTISAADGNAYNYQNLTFDGLTFDNSRIILTGWRNGEEVISNLTVTNCIFRNIYDTTNNAAVHINKDAAEAVNGFTFTNNVIDGATGGSKSGIYVQVTGNVVVTGNVINNVSFRPYVIQVTTDDGIADSFVVTGNTFSGSKAGRAQGLGNNAEGTDQVNLVVSQNIFKGITDSQQICYWNFNAEKTTAALSHNYYDIDIAANPSRIYYNKAASSVADLVEMGVYPIYTELNADGTINENSLTTAE